MKKTKSKIENTLGDISELKFGSILPDGRKFMDLTIEEVGKLKKEEIKEILKKNKDL